MLPPALMSLVLILGALSSASQLHYTTWHNQRHATKGKRGAHTLKNSPRQELYGLHGLPFAYFRSFVNQKRRASNMRSTGSSEVPMAMNALGASR